MGNVKTSAPFNYMRPETVEGVCAGRLMMGSDALFPIGDPVPIKLINAAGFGQDAHDSIKGGLAMKLLEIGEDQ
jgi:hypothetical protein